MKITIAKNAGFCFGVKRATDFVESLIEKKDGNTEIYTLGNLIHNDTYIKSLESRGVYSIDLDTALKKAESVDNKKIYFIIRTHGIEKKSEEKLRALAERNPNLQIVDMTCPFVKRIHKIASDNTDDSSLFILLGNESHPEVKGILSYVAGEHLTFSSEDELTKLLENENLAKK
ncbi:MAG: hypothetical protein IIW20_03260, partial [Clostridia bacterium]|nr:hypothetical protein [Clostridia bacterium]